MNEPATVLIVDDDPAIRQALELLMDSADLASHSFSSGGALLSATMPFGPCCVLLDLRLPDIDGLDVQQELRRHYPNLPVIFLTGHADVPAAVKALKYGAVDFFEKPDFDRQQLLDTIREAIAEHRKGLAQQEAAARVREGAADLSPREFEVARRAAAGKANKVIGIELGISERTVEVHRGRAMKKLGLRRAAELVRAEPVLSDIAGH